MNMTAYVQGWQLQCCGEPFSVGEVVAWTCSRDVDEDFLASMFGAGNVPDIDLVEDHHDVSTGERRELAGRVTAISAVTCGVELRDDGWYPVTGTAELTSLRTADGWESDVPPGRSTSFYGYLVDIDVDTEIDTEAAGATGATGATGPVMDR